MSDSHHARLDWDSTGQPLSSEFGDLYFSRDNGLLETRHVFLDGNRLGERIAALADDGRLCVGETGFGTGLNFLCCWQLFEALAPAGARLHYISVEKYPLSRADLQRALALWPELAAWAEPLQAQYVGIAPGFQRLQLAAGRVQLTLLIGDAQAQLEQLDARIDAWFLDGFAPAKNPQMWQPGLFAQLARLSAAGATLATFTSAGFVRRGLIEAGFAMRRSPGFGRKREMLCGDFSGPPAAAVAPWYARPVRQGERRALVIGGGLAGCASAYSLAIRGWQVTLIERHAGLAEEASGNPQGVLYLKLSAHGTALSELTLAGFGYSRRLLEQLPADQAEACGVLQLAFDEREAARQQQLAAHFPDSLLQWLEQPEAETRAGVPLASGGLWFAEAGWIHPPALCRLLASHPNIQRRHSSEALRLERRDGLWQAFAEQALLAEAPVAVLAAAAETRRFAASLPLRRIRGQISQLRQTAASAALRCVLCGEGYVAPARLGEHSLGASFDLHGEQAVTSAAEHAGNLELLRALSAGLAEQLQADRLDPQQMHGRAAFRCSTPDYLPLIGPLAEPQAFAHDYAALSRDARLQPDTPCPWLPGLYLNSAHGSRGLISAPLAGELIAAWLEDEPLPVSRHLAEACHPNRFALRQLIRGPRARPGTAG